MLQGSYAFHQNVTQVNMSQLLAEKKTQATKWHGVQVNPLHLREPQSPLNLRKKEVWHRVVSRGDMAQAPVPALRQEESLLFDLPCELTEDSREDVEAQTDAQTLAFIRAEKYASSSCASDDDAAEVVNASNLVLGKNRAAGPTPMLRGTSCYSDEV